MKALESRQHYMHLYINFQDIQGQLALQSMVGSGRISSSSEILWLSLLLSWINMLTIHKNDEDKIKNQGSKVLTTLIINFQTFKGS